MIDIKTKIHDKFAIEFKFAYKVRRKVKSNVFSLNTWIFVPNSLDINSQTYKRGDFYKDIRTNVRLITPVFLFREIASGNAVPLNNLKTAMEQLAIDPTRTNIAEYEYQIKMFAVIFKSSLSNHLTYIFDSVKGDKKQLIDEVLLNVQDILDKYKELSHIIKTPTVSQEIFNYYLFGYEFMSNVTEKELGKAIVKMEKQSLESYLNLKSTILNILERERQYKIANNFTVVNPDSTDKNSDFIFRLGALKKYIESDLFLNAKKKRDGVLAEQVYYSIAAGLAMIFATSIAFAFQNKYGNFTIPLFAALVISYMLKDRIKDLMRYYFVHKKSTKYYDNKTNISIKDKEIGFSKESFDFVSETKVPVSVMKVRNRIPLIEADNRFSKEKIILFRKIVNVNREALSQNANYNVDGIVEIIRLNMLSFMRKTDNPEFMLYVPDDNNSIKQIAGTRNYYMNIVLQAKYEDTETIQRYRVIFNHDGICSIKEICL